MDYKIIWTDPACDAPHEIVRHIAKDNPRMAQKFGLELIERMEVTAHFPRLGPLFQKEGPVEIRCLNHGDYRLYYRFGARPGKLKS